MYQHPRAFGLRAIALSIALAIVSGCATSNSIRLPETSSLAVGNKNSPAQPELTGMSYFGNNDDSERLSELWQKRTGATPFSDFPIGPGDELVINVAPIVELSDVTTRVSARGDVALPLVGRIQAQGRTETQLQDELLKRLAKYMRNPECRLFVKEYRSRLVAVLGAVAHPGVLPLSSPSETILELISRAGGATDGAADRIIFVPATGAESAPNQFALNAANNALNTANNVTSDNAPMRRNVLRVNHLQPAANAGRNDPLAINAEPSSSEDDQSDGPSGRPQFVGSNSKPLVIALRSDSSGGSQRYLNMPLRPGDVVVVPSSGQVAVVGWVYNPGSFKVTSGLNVLAAIGAAGGPLFAANEHDVRLMRTAADGSAECIHLDLPAIRAADKPDIPVQGNDVIEVTYSDAKIIPYIFYNIMNNKFGGVGLAMPTP